MEQLRKIEYFSCLKVSLGLSFVHCHLYAFLGILLYVFVYVSCFIVRDSYRTVTVTEIMDGTERYSLSPRSAILAKTVTKT